MFVPPAFLLLLKMSLYRLVASGMISKELVGSTFWDQLRTKFCNAVAYKKRMQVNLVRPFIRLSVFTSLFALSLVLTPDYGLLSIKIIQRFNNT